MLSEVPEFAPAVGSEGLRSQQRFTSDDDIQELLRWTLEVTEKENCQEESFASSGSLKGEERHFSSEEPSSEEGRFSKKKKDVPGLPDMPGLNDNDLEKALDYLLDPCTGSPAKGKKVNGLVLMHVDDLLVIGTKEFREWFVKKIEAD